MRGAGLWGVLALGALAGAPAAASAQVLASSTFDSGTEGWEVGNFANATGSSAPSFVSAGGNPGGFIRTTDIFGWNAFQAPGAFLGNQSAAYGGSISLDTRIVSGDGPACSLLTMGNGSTALHFVAAQPSPNNAWVSYVVPLLASAGWRVGGPTCGAGGLLATEAQLQTVLGGLTFLNMNADWQSGGDQVDLDNFVLNGPGVSSVPEPATVTLTAAGLLALGAAARRRARTA